MHTTTLFNPPVDQGKDVLHFLAIRDKEWVKGRMISLVVGDDARQTAQLCEGLPIVLCELVCELWVF